MVRLKGSDIMRRSSVNSGLRLIIIAVASIILAAFFHDTVASLLFLNPGGETEFIFLGLFWGGIIGFCGIVVTLVGLLRAPAPERAASILKPLVVLSALVILFMYLLFSSWTAPEQPTLRPGETITI